MVTGQREAALNVGTPVLVTGLSVRMTPASYQRGKRPGHLEPEARGALTALPLCWRLGTPGQHRPLWPQHKHNAPQLSGGLWKWGFRGRRLWLCGAASLGSLWTAPPLRALSRLQQVCLDQRACQRCLQAVRQTGGNVCYVVKRWPNLGFLICFGCLAQENI